jgi:hypothetical protein
MDAAPGVVEHDPPAAAPGAAAVWTREPLDGDVEFDPRSHSCFMCEKGQDDSNATVARIQTVLARRGEVSDTVRFMSAGEVQCRLKEHAGSTAEECARKLLVHEKSHIIETSEVNAENIQTLRLATRHLRRGLQRRNEETGETDIDEKRLAVLLKVVKLTTELLKLKPVGLPFTARRRTASDVARKTPY